MSKALVSWVALILAVGAGILAVALLVVSRRAATLAVPAVSAGEAGRLKDENRELQSQAAQLALEVQTLRERLAQLETEIEKVREENAVLSTRQSDFRSR